MKINIEKGSKNRQFSTDFMEHLAILLIALKLCKVIDWDWWLVLFPLWIGAALLLLMAVLIWLLSKRKRGWSK